ncbi:hypothetical protein PAPYR_2670 [Paratrimastix pyriformis]|uniref:Uncharacterized protein n=1 Tax=Paratrimastix pyriformis TaxID=342808 RepID=A0ABQ8UTH1_9EUKA|nr:hypothetical protein PAPYR_2670 [Paratrimastix pyriformis]
MAHASPSPSRPGPSVLPVLGAQGRAAAAAAISQDPAACPQPAAGPTFPPDPVAPMAPAAPAAGLLVGGGQALGGGQTLFATMAEAEADEEAPAPGAPVSPPPETATTRSDPSPGPGPAGGPWGWEVAPNQPPAPSFLWGPTPWSVAPGPAAPGTMDMLWHALSTQSFGGLAGPAAAPPPQPGSPGLSAAPEPSELPVPTRRPPPPGFRHGAAPPPPPPGFGQPSVRPGQPQGELVPYFGSGCNDEGEALAGALEELPPEGGADLGLPLGDMGLGPDGDGVEDGEGELADPTSPARPSVGTAAAGLGCRPAQTG